MKCPICGKPTTNKYKPFCSKRCADIDLDKWFNGNYVIHTEEAPNDDALNQ
ncbi:MAG: DNA gyrase inhibitor YacG [Alphaproteobacteria bacterium]|nr:DNA gyrase inhibitor YacG [Alphaproteobacteria bacterium]